MSLYSTAHQHTVMPRKPRGGKLLWKIGCDPFLHMTTDDWSFAGKCCMSERQGFPSPCPQRLKWGSSAPSHNPACVLSYKENWGHRWEWCLPGRTEHPEGLLILLDWIDPQFIEKLDPSPCVWCLLQDAADMMGKFYQSSTCERWNPLVMLVFTVNYHQPEVTLAVRTQFHSLLFTRSRPLWHVLRRD